MRSIWGGIIIILAVAILLPTQAGAQPILTTRCTLDNRATNAEAEARVEWARKCGLLRNVGSPALTRNTGLAAANGGTLLEYDEADLAKNPTGDGVYTGPDYSFHVNETYVFAIYLSGPTYQNNDAFGFKKWTRDSWRKKGRTLYPTFGTTPNLTDFGNKQLFPHPTNTSDCNLYTDQAGTAQSVSTTFHVNGYCEAACYTPEQELLFSDGNVRILDAVNARREDLITLAPGATLDNLELQQNRTYSYTVEARDALHDIFVITTRSGGQLRVTNEHPVINGEGRMVQAQTLKVGHELVKADGTPDEIVSIEKTTHFGKVYNIRPVSTDLVSNVLVAQGFLVGSVRFQNDEVGYINRVILYRGTPAELIP
ncbi:intein [Archangium gephyra]|uniref:Cell surface protein n=1 Tax=Archangium gephyra TaxID=48 RepID=A0AAC8QF73_9BACT|nr:Hint domain-containing protein [Archangium gephyra]AKJ06035.1 putative cell surface protein [Archangium gephyra]REG27214.1 intein [Archangium gephyra]